jgi:hypothetical protein
MSSSTSPQSRRAPAHSSLHTRPHIFRASTLCHARPRSCNRVRVVCVWCACGVRAVRVRVRSTIVVGAFGARSGRVRVAFGARRAPAAARCHSRPQTDHGVCVSRARTGA